MPTQQLVYEGSDLQALIQRVVDEHGPARIRPPERKRKGGVFGFFAREVYVISVDPAATEHAAVQRGAGNAAPPRPATAAATTGRVRTGTGSTLATLAEATQDDLTLDSVPVAPTDTSGAGPTPATDGVTGASGPTSPRDDGSGSGTGPLRRTAPGDGPAPTTAPTPAGTPSTSRVKPFDQVLAEVASSLGEEPGTYQPDPRRLRKITRLTPPPAAPMAPRLVPLPTPAAEPEPEPDPTLGATRRPATAVHGTPAAPAEHGAAAGEVDLADVLHAVGFPEELLDAPSAPEPPSNLAAVFAGLPEPPSLPSVAGALVAIVGEPKLIRPVVRAVAEAVGCPEDEIAVAARSGGARSADPDRRASTPLEAAQLAPGWRRDRVGVVAVHAPRLGADQRWTRDVLHALRPSCVWGAATATTKPDDVRRFVEAIGGLDALAVTDVTATATPAAVLSAQVPVAQLDGKPATPEQWVAVVTDAVART